MGIGTQDDLEEARDFRRDTGIRSFRLLWDESYTAWEPFDFVAQPSAVLLAADGSELARWSGPVRIDELADALP